VSSLSRQQLWIVRFAAFSLTQNPPHNAPIRRDADIAWLNIAVYDLRFVAMQIDQRMQIEMPTTSAFLSLSNPLFSIH
jgi:hypothetical protein